MGLKSLDFLGVHDFIYGGDPEWVRRRWFMVMTLSVGQLGILLSCLGVGLGFLPIDLAQTVITSVFAITGPTVLGYLGFAAWEKKIRVSSDDQEGSSSSSSST